MSFLKSIFSGKSKNDSELSDPNKILLEKVNISIDKCKKDKEISYNEIDEIKKWSKEIIWEIFKVPTAYWYEELKEYENIRFSEENNNVSKRLTEKTNFVIKGYREQLEIRLAKIKLIDTLLDEYNKTKKKLVNTIDKISQLNKEEQQIKLLESHSKRINKMSLDDHNLEDAYSDSGDLENLNFEIRIAEDEYQLQEDFLNQFVNLTEDYKRNTDSESYSVFRNEIEKLIGEVNKSKKG